MTTRTGKTRIAWTLIGLLCGHLIGSGVAQAEGDKDAGQKKAYTCTGCHGIPGYTNAYPNYHVPRIGGQNYQYLVNALKAYRAGERKHPVMEAQAGSMTDQDIEDVATYLAELGKKG